MKIKSLKCDKCGAPVQAIGLTPIPGNPDMFMIIYACGHTENRVITPDPCPYLDQEKHWCNKYKRFQGSAAVFECKYGLKCIFG